jgi:hypothetical protein
MRRRTAVSNAASLLSENTSPSVFNAASPREFSRKCAVPSP